MQTDGAIVERWSISERIPHLKLGQIDRPRDFSWFSEQSLANRLVFAGTYSLAASFERGWLVGKRADGKAFASSMELNQIGGKGADEHLRRGFMVGPMHEEDAAEIELRLGRALHRTIDRADSDYIYSSAALVALQGPDYSKSRQYVRRLRREGVQALPFRPTDCEAAMHLLVRWRAQHPDSAGQLDVKETELAIELAQNGALQGVGLWRDGAMLAFLLCDVSIDDTVVALIMKTDRSIQGLSEFCYQSFLREWPDKSYVNTCQDLGIPGLRSRKLAMRPLKIQQKVYLAMADRD